MQSGISVSLQSHLLQFGIPTCQAAPESFGSQMEKFVHKFIFPTFEKDKDKKAAVQKNTSRPNFESVAFLPPGWCLDPREDV